MNKPLIISAVRDKAMYEKCIAGNSFCVGLELRPVDNTAKNERIPVLYNRVLEALSGTDSCWLIFCHEDFMLKEPIGPWLESADVTCIYGTIGGVLRPRKRWMLGGIWPGVSQGEILESKKDGSCVHVQGSSVSIGTRVETVDCQFLAVHSSLVQKYGLRFDENLSFDLYTEDFCLGAFLSYGIETAILPIKCQHFSGGLLQPRFFEQKAYLDRKYPKVEAFGSCGYTIGGGRTVMRRFQKRVRAFLDKHARFAVRWYFKLIG